MAMHWFFLVARIAEISFSIALIVPLPLLLATLNRARVVHPVLRQFLIIFVLSMGGAALMNTLSAVLSTLRDVPDRLRTIDVKLTPVNYKTAGSLCQMLACNSTVLAWLALLFCSFERLASTRVPDKYDRRYRTREATVISLCFFIPIAVILIHLQYAKTTDLVFAYEMGVLFCLNFLLLLIHLCTESRLLHLPPTITKKFQVRQNIKVHQAFLRLSKHFLCWGAGVLLVLFWATIVMRTSSESHYYEAIYFLSQSAIFLLALYLLFTEPVLQPALRSFMISRWILRKSSGALPIPKIADSTVNLDVNANNTWRPK